ncbi:MAG: hypothetical protein U9N50_03110 [Pseudomonadota bacterium]|nr:hypothetical protein [Pseudomonadota bacterium]
MDTISEIEMLPSVGKPDHKAAASYVLPLLLEELSYGQHDENCGNLSEIEQRPERCIDRRPTPGTSESGN